MSKEHDVIIIGGGQSGLASAYYLRRKNIDFLILDNQKESGGAWLHTWDSLRLFSPAEHSSLPGWFMPKTDDEYPHKNDVIDYLKKYEERYEFPVERPVNVENVSYEDEQFVLHTDNGEYRCKVLISATGTWKKQFIPNIEGLESFKGESVHSAHYKSPKDFEGKNVLVVGEGNSGAQIAAELYETSNVTWMTKNEPDFMDKEIDGRHLFEINTKRYKKKKEQKEHDLPEDKEEVLKAYGTKWGIVQVPPVREALKKGQLEHEPQAQKFTEDGIIDHKGNFKPIDAIIWCTGFRPALDHLKSLDIFDGERVKCEELRSTGYPNLWFIGYGNWTGFASATLIGVGRTAKHAAESIAEELAELAE